jgi:uncharacterized HAD superfamily protein
LIVFDIDDTISSTMEVIRAHIYLSYNIDINEHINQCVYESIVIPGMSRWELLDTVHVVLSRHYTQIKPEPLVKEYLPKFQEKFGKLTFLTGRSSRLSVQTEMWFDYTFGRRTLDKEIIYTNNKSEFMKNKNIKYFVDDRIKFINQCIDHVGKVFMIDKPWNRGFVHEKIEVVKNIKEVYERIEENETRNS